MSSHMKHKLGGYSWKIDVKPYSINRSQKMPISIGRFHFPNQCNFSAFFFYSLQCSWYFTHIVIMWFWQETTALAFIIKLWHSFNVEWWKSTQISRIGWLYCIWRSRSFYQHLPKDTATIWHELLTSAKTWLSNLFWSMIGRAMLGTLFPQTESLVCHLAHKSSKLPRLRGTQFAGIIDACYSRFVISRVFNPHLLTNIYMKILGFFFGKHLVSGEMSDDRPFWYEAMSDFTCKLTY